MYFWVLLGNSRYFQVLLGTKNNKYEVWIQLGGQLPLVHKSIDPCSHWCKLNRQNPKFALEWLNFPKSLFVLDRSREEHSLPTACSENM